MLNAAKKLNVPTNDTQVRALVSLMEDDSGGFHLGVELRAKIPGADQNSVRKVMEEAHREARRLVEQSELGPALLQFVEERWPGQYGLIEVG